LPARALPSASVNTRFEFHQLPARWMWCRSQGRASATVPALTTYLSLAVRYAVRDAQHRWGGSRCVGVIRKITSARSLALKELVQRSRRAAVNGSFCAPRCIAYQFRDRARHSNNLILCGNRGDLTRSPAGADAWATRRLADQRSLRDLYNKGIDEIQVGGDRLTRKPATS